MAIKLVRRLGVAVMVLGFFGFFMGARAVEETDLLKRIEALEARLRAMEALEREVADLREKVQVRGVETLEAGREFGAEDLPRKSQVFARKGISPAFGGLYTKPFLRRFGTNVYVGGYMDMEYFDDEDSNARFDQHRLIPFIYADVSDRVKFATEIEFEHGGPQNNQKNGDVKVEFAMIDYLIREEMNFRTGILLSPLGKLNLVHDSPLQDLTNRPLVATNVIPTTLSEAGAGLYGSLYPTEMSKVDYEAYIVNGFSGTTSTGAPLIDTDNGLRDARGSQRSDVNDNPAFVGRLAMSPFLGLETGLSAHLGDYDAAGKNFLAVYALDATYQNGPWELLFEGAIADIERDARLEGLGVPGELWAYYVQTNYHFMPASFREWWPKIFTEESTFTLVLRGEQQALGADTVERYTAGVNFRPKEDTVFKLSHEWNTGDDVANDEVQLSAATYF